MYKCFILGLLLAGLVAACGGGDENPTPEQPTAIVEADDTATQEPSEDLPGQVMVPGVRVTDGLAVLRSTTFTLNDQVGWIVLEVRNDNPNAVANIEATASLLDADNRERGFQRTISPFANIPSGRVVPLVLEFGAPPDYTTFLALVEVDETTQGGFENLIGEFDLPAQLDPIPGGGYPLVLTGTLTNDRGVVLIAPVAMITAEDSGGNLLGAALTSINGLSAEGNWEPGATLTFMATFPYLPQAIAQTQIISAGYRLPQ